MWFDNHLAFVAFPQEVLVPVLVPHFERAGFVPDPMRALEAESRVRRDEALILAQARAEAPTHV